MAIAGCGGGTATGATEAQPRLVVSAAASLKSAFTEYAKGLHSADVRFSFAGSDELAAQIVQGVRPDVFAAANTKLPEQLHAKGLVERPVVFAGNRLVLAVPSSESGGGAGRVSALADLARPGIDIAIGAPGVPIGAYTRTVLGRLPSALRERVLVNVRSQEPDVAGIVGKLTQGAVDAGFVYVSDVRASDGRLVAIDLPADLQPAVAYGAAVVRGTRRPEQARAFIDGLVSGGGQEALRAAGFEPPPSS
ncbi:MAG: molybdate ABC transporter substrate-binding protein [Solirubrobacteraceae bacterium]|nr:molybdate ABC transporter substrate-binding protein [Solirubrobacteraceae bacterium]